MFRTTQMFLSNAAKTLHPYDTLRAAPTKETIVRVKNIFANKASSVAEKNAAAQGLRLVLKSGDPSLASKEQIAAAVSAVLQAYQDDVIESQNQARLAFSTLALRNTQIGTLTADLAQQETENKEPKQNFFRFGTYAAGASVAAGLMMFVAQKTQESSDSPFQEPLKTDKALEPVIAKSEDIGEILSELRIVETARESFDLAAAIRQRTAKLLEETAGDNS